MVLPDLHLALGKLEWKAFNELNDVCDYIWKSPRLITHEKALEARKLSAYFPNGGPGAEARKRYQSIRLDETFPRLIAVGNLFSALSIFENHVLLLLKILQEHDRVVPKQETGRGVTAHLKATKAYGAEPYNAIYYEQISSAISIRNCLMHAKGLVDVFGKADTLRAQVSQCKFLSSEDRKRRTEPGRLLGSDLVTFEDSELGDTLVITNDYSHLVSFYLREYFCSLCGTLNPNTALRPRIYEIDPRELAPESLYEGPIM